MTIEFTHDELKRILCMWYNTTTALNCYSADNVDMSVSIPIETKDPNQELIYKFSFIKKEDIQ